MDTNKQSLSPPLMAGEGSPDCLITVEVAYARPEKQRVIAVKMPPGSSIEDAIHASGILNVFPEIDLQKQAVGIFSQRKTLKDTLAEGDRIEIYRNLIADPKEVRRRRAAEQKKRGIVR